MPSMRFNIKGAVGNEDAGGTFYDGPIPAKGTYTGKLKIVKVQEIKNGANAGKPRLQILAEITGPKNAKNIKGGSCIGAGVWGGANVTDQGVPFVNQFLNALTNGSEAQKVAIQKAFWEKSVPTDDEGNIEKIGRWLINSPNGELPVAFTVKHSTYNGELQAQIGRWLVKEDKTDEGVDAEADADEDEDPDLEDADVEDEDDNDDPY